MLNHSWMATQRADPEVGHDSQDAHGLTSVEVARPHTPRGRKVDPNQDRVSGTACGRARVDDCGVAEDLFSLAIVPPRMGTKADTLARLRGRLASGQVLPQVTFTVRDWRHDAGAVLAKVQAAFASSELVVRSSARVEDTYERSNAGAFESRLGVPNFAPAVRAAIEAVIASYGAQSGDHDQVLVQPQLTDVATCGVVFTHTLTGQPYFVVESDSSGKTDVVTGGANGTDVMFVRHGVLLEGLPDHVASAIALVTELQTVLRQELLDVEYAIDRFGRVFLLQVRPLVAAAKKLLAAAGDKAFQAARAEVVELSKPAPGIVGPPILLSDMSDWNPAELVGGRPRPLAVSLFHHLITEKTWRAARARLGYNDPADTELLTVIAGHPYIDVRASARSLLPKALPAQLRERIVAEALALLAQHLHLHDKIEFGVVPSAFTPAFDEIFLARFTQSGFSSTEIDEVTTAIRAQTEKLISGDPESVQELMAEIHQIDQARALLTENAGEDPLGVVEALVRDAREHGFEAFGAIARLAFIGAAFLRGLVEVGAIRRDRADGFLRSLRTVAGELAEALAAYGAGMLDVKALLEQFGHLRPSSFDVTSPRYDENPELYLGGAVARGEIAPTPEPFAWTEDELERIFAATRATGLTVEAGELLRFIGDATVAREEGKFVVSRSVSDALKLLTAWGESQGLTREELSYMTLSEILSLRGEPDARARGRRFAEAGAARHAADSTVLVPDVITGPEGLDVVTYVSSQPNFCGTDRVVSAPVVVEAGATGGDVSGRVVLIESADPGFDWILARGIAGLVTRYGGAASHMAIRCAEFGIPAAIGVGVRFDVLARSARIDLDPSNGRVEALT